MIGLSVTNFHLFFDEKTNFLFFETIPS
ncbi:DUF4024 domain-containing protein [Microbacteriaceae bacterium 4G12]